MKVVRKFYADPAHGWLAVKTAELTELGIANEITGYSYQKGKTSYLEEDRDAMTYVMAQRKRGIEVETDERYTNKASPIRSYHTYKV
jgi:hypothetical protein